MNVFVADYLMQRERRLLDKQFLLRNVLEGLDALNVQVSAWPYVRLTSAHLSSVDRTLDGVKRLLRDLHHHVTED